MSTTFGSNISPDFLLEIDTLLMLCSTFRTPRCMTIKLMVENEMFEELSLLKTKPDDYANNPSSVQKFKDDYLVTDFLKKSPNLPLKADRRAEAVKSFYEGEYQCEVSTLKLRSLDPFSIEVTNLNRVKTMVHSIVGPVTRRTLQKIESSMRFGPGSTTRVNGTFVGSVKFDGSPHLTSNLYPFYKSILGPLWHASASEPEIVSGNKFTTVPKNAKTDRGICIEPDLNVYVQLGIGTILRSRLASAGINLNDQTINQKMAARAQKDSLATIDLARASDTVSHYLVWYLFPDDWFSLLDLCRSPTTRIDGDVVVNSKFSSMGNGYTFELESLVFTAIVRTVVPVEYWNDVSIYGDDLILPAKFADEVIDLLQLCGFAVNRDKSFLAGSFFESCGCDYFNHVPVRPFYARGAVKGIPYSIQLANALRVYSKRDGFCDDRYKSVWLKLKRLSPTDWQKCPVPENLGDTGIICDKIESRFNMTLPSNQWDGVYVNHIELRPKKTSVDSIGLLLINLTRIGSEDSWTGGFLPVRGLFGRSKSYSVFVNTWVDDLCWKRFSERT